MRKKYLQLTLVFFAAFFMASICVACALSTPNILAADTPPKTPEEIPLAQVADSVLRYEYPAIGIGIVFPPEYEGKYTIETKFSPDAGSFIVYHAPTMELMAENGYGSTLGTLFWVYRTTKADDEVYQVAKELGRFMLETDEYGYFLRTPTGVEYDGSEPEPWQTTEYKALQDDDLIEQIIASAYAVPILE